MVAYFTDVDEDQMAKWSNDCCIESASYYQARKAEGYQIACTLPETEIPLQL